MIYSLLLLMSFGLSALGQGFIHAPVITGNEGTTYTATLRNSASTTIRGTITAGSAPGGTGLTFRVSFTGLPPNLGPFPYHIHVEPVPANGDCYATGSHLDPYNRGETPLCNAGDPSTCQIGDLSGKHGNATDTTFSAEYTDVYLSNIPGNSAFIGNRSIVIHASDGARLNCGNFEAAGGAATPSHPPTGQTSTRVAPTTLTTTHSVPTGTTSTYSARTQTTTAQSSPTGTTSTHPTSIGTTSTYSVSTRSTITQVGPTTLSTRTLPTPSTSTVR